MSLLQVKPFMQVLFYVIYVCMYSTDEFYAMTSPHPSGKAVGVAPGQEIVARDWAG